MAKSAFLTRLRPAAHRPIDRATRVRLKRINDMQVAFNAIHNGQLLDF